MRYESFYPFARHQSPPPGQQDFGLNSFSAPPQNPSPSPQFGMPNNPFSNQRPDPMQGQQFGPGPAQGLGPGQNPGQGPSKIDGYMQTANRFLNTAQQFAPVVQQFAPMMQNLPAMWRLYKGFQSLPVAGEAAAGQVASSAARATAQSVAPTQGPLPSIPRVFQPPS